MPVSPAPRDALLERDSELTALRASAVEAAAGRGSVTVVVGEAGVGKTSLVRAFVSGIRGRVLWGACDPLSAPRVLGPLYDIALQLGGEFAAAMASDAGRHERFAALRAELQARPGVLVLEDAHWADDATQDLLVHLARRIHLLPTAIVVTARDDELDRDHPVAATLGRLAHRDQPRRLHLAPLGRESVARLAPELDPEEVIRLTGGNPFFVTELAAASTVDAVPATVRDAVLARAARLAPADRRTLDAVALASGPADIRGVLEVAEVPPTSVDECVRAGMLIGAEARISFRHELARRAVADAVPPAAAATVHRRWLATLSARPGTDPARLSHHAALCADAGTFRHAVTAALRASRLGAHRLARVQYERALAFSAGEPRERVAETWESLAEENYAVADHADELRCAQAAAAIWRELDRIDDEAAATAATARALWNLGRGPEARVVADRALALLAGRDGGARHATTLAQVAHIRMLAREIDDAVALSTRAAQLAHAAGDPRAAIAADRVLGTSLWFVDPGRADAPLRRSIETAERLGDDIKVAQGLVNLGSAAGEVRAYATAETALRESIAWCTARDLDTSAAYATAWLARIEFERGRWDAAIERARSVGDAAGVISRIVALTVIGAVRVRRGDSGAEGPLEEAWRLALDTGDLQRLWPVAAARAEFAWHRGHADQIPSIVAETFRLAVHLDQEWPIGELAFWLARAGELGEPPARAAAPFAAAVRRDHATAAALWDDLGCPYERALALAETDAAVEGLVILHDLGAAPEADALAHRLREAGARGLPRRPRRSTSANPAGLTRRELEVADLVVRGATDHEIADALHISVRTAGHHVSSILAKLGVTSRAAVSHALRSRGMLPL